MGPIGVIRNSKTLVGFHETVAASEFSMVSHIQLATHGVEVIRVEPRFKCKTISDVIGMYDNGAPVFIEDRKGAEIFNQLIRVLEYWPFRAEAHTPDSIF